jgi:hypothetical protein
MNPYLKLRQRLSRRAWWKCGSASASVDLFRRTVRQGFQPIGSGRLSSTKLPQSWRLVVRKRKNRETALGCTVGEHRPTQDASHTLLRA